jgi:FAD/FMN-containing dehydrogenase
MPTPSPLDDPTLDALRDALRGPVVAPAATGGVYVNLLGADEADRVASAYGTNYDRLARVKDTYDPDNLFRSNHNVAPAAA